uniref:AlNc14C27G2657 protein n=1 Tax=Albugo laibachii Nc14 TaxID=890382 RepID=F0W728_9STRA|nr:AlNc14C27G2657 [Albugo laibachii Nc14]|eukprot:CCA16927.1 AlNc14C27G2657 [Albugo laibachii Nc14]
MLVDSLIRLVNSTALKILTISLDCQLHRAKNGLSTNAMTISKAQATLLPFKQMQEDNNKTQHSCMYQKNFAILALHGLTISIDKDSCCKVQDKAVVLVWNAKSCR